MRAKRLFRLTKHFLLIKLEHQSNRVACAVCRCTLVNNNNFVKRGDARAFQAHIVVFLHRNIPFTRNSHRMPIVVIVAVTAPDDVRFMALQWSHRHTQYVRVCDVHGFRKIIIILLMIIIICDVDRIDYKSCASQPLNYVFFFRSQTVPLWVSTLHCTMYVCINRIGIIRRAQSRAHKKTDSWRNFHRNIECNWHINPSEKFTEKKRRQQHYASEKKNTETVRL